MCGITGGYYIHELPDTEILESSISKLSKRGPDNQGLKRLGQAFLGHRRLSILDVSEAGNQPISDETGRYTLVFNGEIYNFRELRKSLIEAGHSFRSTGDTEVLLKAYIEYGPDCLAMLNGFFAFAIHDASDESIFIARDRLGIKPLHYYVDEDKVLFSSEVKALYPLQIKREIDYNTLAIYFQLNYIPAPYGIYKNLRKLLPGHWMRIDKGEVRTQQWYELEHPNVDAGIDYENAQKQLADLLDDAVHKRLVSDVPLGTFLSGGIDSSVITSLASRHQRHLNTFSIGFKDEAFFDETQYAELVAERLKTNHTVFKLSNDDLLDSLNTLLEYIDEPFADSSALLVNLLSKYTRQHVTVALSGDGGDELFAGYNKHYGEWRLRKGGLAPALVSQLLPVWRAFPKGRHDKFSNKVRQLERFGRGKQLNDRERYWDWCSFIDRKTSMAYFGNSPEINESELIRRMMRHTDTIGRSGDLNDVLYADVNLVLPYDMLTKVDLMSMANALEVRVPLLDHRIAEFAFKLPVEHKIDGKMKKKILQDAFRHILPSELYNRPKRGFEVPLLQWFRKELKDLIMDDLLSDNFIAEQGIFNGDVIKSLKKRLFSSNPGDVHAQIWALIVFQSWYKNYHIQ